eukprot:GHVH01004325.1.p1 GENE.GHVH01004325.1~~GHVH01004325.1.p1  ORF type:complete len:289 (+),score=48.03 GHVH01004325.1:107-973(+)
MVRKKSTKNAPNAELAKPQNTLPGAISVKAQTKKRVAAKKRREDYDLKRLSKDHLNPESSSTRQQPIVFNPKKPYEVKGKSRKVPRLPRMTPEEVVAEMKAICANLPPVPEAIPEVPETTDVYEFIDNHTDLQFTDETQTKCISARTGHMMPVENIELLKSYVSGKRYAVKYLEGEAILKEGDIDMNSDWQPFLVPHKYSDDKLLSVLRGKSINKTLPSIKNELTCSPFETRLEAYLVAHKTKLDREYAKIQRIIERIGQLEGGNETMEEMEEMEELEDSITTSEDNL